MTPRQKQLLDAIRALTVDDVPPSYEELRAHCGLTSKGEVYRMVCALEGAGYLVRLPHLRRSLVLTTPDPLDAMSSDALLALRSEIDRRLAA